MALEGRQHPQIGDEIVGVLAGAPPGRFAVPFADQDLGPMLGAEIRVSGLGAFA